MDSNELLEKYQALLIENNKLREEVKRLKDQLGIIEPQNISDTYIYRSENQILEEKPDSHVSTSDINNKSNSVDKIKLFMSLFKGREDVFAKRWENRKKGTAGYTPVCANEWKPGVCQKPQIRCADCKCKNYLAINEKVIDDHLRGRDNFVAGIYPMCLDETCNFLVIDFDDEEWQKDITILEPYDDMSNSQKNLSIAVLNIIEKIIGKYEPSSSILMIGRYNYDA